MFDGGRHVFDRDAAERSVRLGGWVCSCGASFEDLDGLIGHVDDILDTGADDYLID